jgi:formate hydrogenlyase subunit 4
MFAAFTSFGAQCLHIALVLAAAPLVAGLMAWLDARLAGRAGTPLAGPVWDLIRLSRKTPSLPENASPVLAFAPVLSLGATLSAAALVPSFTLGMAMSPLADGLVVASLLTIGRVAACLGALDTGSAQTGRAGEQSSAAAILAEPALLTFVFSVALLGAGFNLDQIIGQQHAGLLLPAAASTVALAALLALAFTDISGLAPDMAADVSGIDLAVDRLAGWLRRIVWIDLIGALFLPIGLAGPDSGPGEWAIGLAFWVMKLIAAALCLSLVRAILGRPARHTLPNMLGIAALLALLATVIVLASAGAS